MTDDNQDKQSEVQGMRNELRRLRDQVQLFKADISQMKSKLQDEQSKTDATKECCDKHTDQINTMRGTGGNSVRILGGDEHIEIDCGYRGPFSGGTGSESGGTSTLYVAEGTIQAFGAATNVPAQDIANGTRTDGVYYLVMSAGHDVNAPTLSIESSIPQDTTTSRKVVLGSFESKDSTAIGYQQWYENGALYLDTVTVPRRMSQASNPTPETNELLIWRDSDNSRMYVMYQDADEGTVYWESGINGIDNTTAIDHTDSPYTATADDIVIYGDTDGGAITINYPAGVEGKYYKIINVGTSGNDITVDGNGSETVYGAATFAVVDGDVLETHFNATHYWW
jgi:hypothetical protein